MTAQFDRYREAAKRRIAAQQAFLAVTKTYREDIQRDGRKITIDLLEGFFDETYGKSDRVKAEAQRAKELIEDFHKAAEDITQSVAMMVLELQTALSTLPTKALAPFFEEMGKPLAPKGNTPLDVARAGMENLSDAGQKLLDGGHQAAIEAHGLELRAEETLYQATILLELRKKHLSEFRQENLSVTLDDLKQRATKEGKDAVAEGLRKELAEILAEVVALTVEEVAQIKRAHKLGRLFQRLMGKKQVNRQRNDTDQLMDLVGLLEKENALLGKLDAVFKETAEAMKQVLESA
ncbi:hypothetical protein SAMN04488093_11335 [Tropicibacter naphthalenivorans]|uniref:Uncharacterized protein n=2 Tax=Tropicibacter naphthalenivorans TaxID=441103 RepID=A0A0P1GK49_9RHOB|nr:hypothetical protein TRN7648_03921 [Tropicibacter naphthalenivorans]SMD05675.1 hypothetical protein SAMN04488093_11335 [Tropicibacter naphthalenivorans]